MKVEEAIPSDHKELTELTIRSKSVWGYGTEQIEEWQDDLTISEEYIDKNNVFKLSANGVVVGYYSYLKIDQRTVKLDNLFIAPEHIGQGYGKFLMQHFIKQVKNASFVKVTLDSDPNAAHFYKNLGFNVVGKLESSIENRYLPIMEKYL